MITSKMPLTRRIKLLLAMIIIAALGVAVVTQVASAQPAAASKHFKVRMINPFYEGIAVKPPIVTYFIDKNATKVTLSDLNWQSWGSARGIATGQDEDGEQIEVVVSAKRKCGLPNMRFYTRITVSGQTFPLQCKVQVISGVDIGQVTENVSAFIPSERGEVYIPYRDASLMGGKWQNLGKPSATGRGVTTSWWTFPDFRWVPSKMTLGKLGYCAQFGTIAYLKVKLTTYGNGIEAGKIPFKRAARLLRKQVGKGSKHGAQYNYRKWCKRKKYPNDYWGVWE